MAVPAGASLAATGTVTEATQTPLEATTFEPDQSHTNAGNGTDSATVVTEDGTMSVEEALAEFDTDELEAVVIESSAVDGEENTQVHALEDEDAELVWGTLLESADDTDGATLADFTNDVTASTANGETLAVDDGEATITTDHGTVVTVEQVTRDRTEQDGESTATGPNSRAEVYQENSQTTNQNATVTVDAERAAVLVVQLNVQENDQTGYAAAAGENASAVVHQENDQRAMQFASVNVTASEAAVVVAQINVQVSEQEAMAAAAGPDATADVIQESSRAERPGRRYRRRGGRECDLRDPGERTD
ncbi:hypothetical protein ACFQMM_06330 [Saliphagus sp. GCM10025308]